MLIRQPVSDVDTLSAMAAPRWLDDNEARAWRGWIQASEHLRAQLNRELQRDTGLSDADFAVLVQLSEAPQQRVRMSDLAGRLAWSKSRLSHQVSRMAERNLLCKENCPNDARGAFAVLTPHGLSEIRRAAPGHVESVRAHLIDLLTPRQLKALAEVFETVVTHLQEIEGGCSPCDEVEDQPPGPSAASSAASTSSRRTPSKNKMASK
jgi:DNA-binding MarR family transcriptional regulator